MNREIFNSLNKKDIISSKIGTGKEPGTGFGLKICYELIYLLKGELYLTEGIENGTEINFSIPVSQAKYNN